MKLTADSVLSAMEAALIAAAIGGLIYGTAFLLMMERRVVPLSMGGGVQYKVLPVSKGSCAEQVFRPALMLEREYLRRRYWSGWCLTTNSSGQHVSYVYDLARQHRQRDRAEPGAAPSGGPADSLDKSMGN
jgi:hypothetical protein